MLNWIKNLFNKKKKEVKTYPLREPSSPIPNYDYPKPGQPNKLEHLPILLQKEMYENKEKDIRLIVFNKPCEIAYTLNRHMIEGIWELSQAEEEKGWVMGVNADIVNHFFRMMTFGWIDRDRTMAFAFLDKNTDKRFVEGFHLTVGDTITKEHYWKMFGVTEKDIRHVRPSNMKQAGRVYQELLVDWFKHKTKEEKPTLKKEGELIVINKDKATRVIKTKWYQIEINHSYVRVFVLKTDRVGLKKLIKEMKKIRRQVPSHHVFVSMLDNSQDLPKGFEVLEDL